MRYSVSFLVFVMEFVGKNHSHIVALFIMYNKIQHNETHILNISLNTLVNLGKMALYRTLPKTTVIWLQSIFVAATLVLSMWFIRLKYPVMVTTTLLYSMLGLTSCTIMQQGSPTTMSEGHRCFLLKSNCFGTSIQVLWSYLSRELHMRSTIQWIPKDTHKTIWYQTKT